MSEIASLKPSGIWKYFDEILQIPRPSKKEEKIVAYLESFAKKSNLQFKRDDIGNVLISKPATPGFENKKSVLLQSHIDMVCEKNTGVDHNFDTDPIATYIEGEWIKAKGTTLGADNGIGIAAQLAVLADESISHGPIECLFTVDEETGLTGAFNLGEGFFDSKILLNLDSEDDGELFIGCAGGIDTLVTMKPKFKSCPNNYISYNIFISGLKGGHSGDDIEKGLANSNKLMNRFLWESNKEFGIRISDFQGGNLRNAIPREARATVSFDPKHEAAFNDSFKNYEATMNNVFQVIEPDMSFELEKVDNPGLVLSKKSQNKLLCALYACPHGPIAMSPNMPGLVETSTNLASVKFNENKEIEIVTSQRSSVESEKFNIANMVKSTFYLAKAKVSHTDAYPGWKPNTDSEILHITENAYASLFGEKPKVRAIHAGLECGLFLKKYPDLDMISFGPTIKGAHSPDERLHIEATMKFWDLLVEVLKNIPE